MRCGVTLVFALLSTLGGCELVCTGRDSALAQLHLIADDLEHCGHPAGADAMIGCVHDAEFARVGKLVDPRLATHDRYGAPIVFMRSRVCAQVRPHTPYSTGPNKTDECGGGDDIVIGWMARAQRFVQRL